MKKLSIILIIIYSGFAFSQTKYLVYFKDKGINENFAINKTSLAYKKAINSISQKSIERRKKTMGDNLITDEDIPINEEYLNELTKSGIKIDKRLKWFNAVSVYLTEEQKNIVQQFPFVHKIEPVKVLKYKRDKYESLTPSTINKSNSIYAFDYGPSLAQNSLSEIPAVHTKGITGEDVIIGLLDSGFRWKEHESLEERIVIAEYDFVFDDSITANQQGDTPNQDSHGTSVFSIIGGFQEGKIVGPAFSSRFILAKTEDIRSETHVEEDNYAAALIWMDSIGVDITSSSLGYSEFDDSVFSYTYEDMDGSSTIVTIAAELAFLRGIVTITSAGNEGNNPWHYITAPADGFNTMGIGAVHNSNEIAGFSGRGPTYDGRIKPDIVAQGVNVYNASVSGFSSYGTGGGTSFSGPIAAGCAALLLSSSPYLNNIQVRDILIRTAGNFYTPDTIRGYGLVSAAKAVSFPNIEIFDNVFTLHKNFISERRIDPLTVRFNYYLDGFDTASIPMDFTDNIKYEYQLNSFSKGDDINFFFTFNDSSGISGRDPENTYYSYEYGSPTVIMLDDTVGVIHPIAFSTILDQNRPNPFTGETTINFNSTGNENAELIIYNILGQKVKTLFKGVTKEGENNYIWNGTNNSGLQVASGVYIYSLNLNGAYHIKKMVYVK